jgi:magnesium transporter
VLTILARTGDRDFEPLPREDLPGALSDPATLVWVDLEDPDDAEVSILAGVFNFHHLTIEDCLNAYVDPPKVDDYEKYLFLIVQGIVYAPKTAAQAEEIETTELNLYLGHSYVVTFHQRPLAAVHEIRERCARGASIPTRGADWLTQALLDTLVDHLLPAVEAMDDRIASLHDEALESGDRSIMRQLTALKRTTHRFRRLVTPQRDLINRLSRGDFPHLIRAETLMHFRDIYDHMVRLEGMIEGLRDLSEDAIAAHLATVNNRLSEIMKALSLTGTIFLPLTLVASIFGTNFAPTYEEWGWTGFIGMCAFMIVSIVALFVWFKRHRWL